MTMCVVVNGAKACYSFNCSCPNKRDRRTINTSEVKKGIHQNLGLSKWTVNSKSFTMKVYSILYKEISQTQKMTV